MASTYSTRLRFELIGSGEQAGTWGNTTNTNLGTLIEEAIAGYVAITHDDTANYTLTATNGAADEARNMFVSIGGTLTAARNAVVPTAEKLYFVKNATSGGYAVTVKTSGGTGISIPNGDTMILMCDGTNVINATPNELPSGTTIGGTAPSLAGHTHAAADVTSGAFDGARVSSANTPFTINASASSQSKMVFAEDTDNGSNTFTLQPPAAITSNFVWQVPDGAGAANQGIIDTDGAGTLGYITLLGQHTISVPAHGMIARTTNGAAAGTLETSTNKIMGKTLDYDPSTVEYAQFYVQMPKGWDAGTLVAQFTWSHPATATNYGVVWGIQAVALGDDDALDTAFGSAVTVTDTGGTTNDIYISPETSAMTVGNSPAAEDWVVYQVYRVATDGADTLAVDARLHNVKIHYTVNAMTDS